MKELIKTESQFFNQYYEGVNENKGVKVMCILDDNCVRYNVFKNGKWGRRHEFYDYQKDLCFKNATRALNRE